MTSRHILAFDLGAGSGRAMLGVLDAGRLHIQELRRFSNAPLNIRGCYHWNVFGLFQEVMESLAACGKALAGARLESIGFDTWGLDFALLAGDGTFLGLPYTYRDSRTEGMMERFLERVPAGRVYELTGIQFMPINTLYQLFALAQSGSPILSCVQDLLFIPDIFNYLLTGEKRTEFTFATTSQLFNPRTMAWEEELFGALGIPRRIMQEVVPPGAIIGKLSPAIGREAGFGQTLVVAPATHDTGSAIAAAPAAGADWAYISSGTWSLMGIESPQALCSDLAREFNFTNEGGVAGTFRFLKNIMGLWLVQQCREAWKAMCEYGYDTLTEMAGASPHFAALIDPNWYGFLNPPDMPAAIRQFCQKTGQPAPASVGATIRCILESLALEYRRVLDQLRQATSRPIGAIHIIGGGTRNRMLCQFTANATGLPVLAGPAEATAIGNILIQALGLGYLGSLAEIRDIVRRSFEVETYTPHDADEWSAAYDRYRRVLPGAEATGSSRRFIRL
jgi:rhamnulokinase